ncbi:MAG: hypothetical protein Q4E72_08940 [bacterium]|nr:hypothetical protein [bacterium]
MPEALTREAIAQNLRDAGCDECLIEQFLAGEMSLCSQLRLLEKHRCCLLRKLHSTQKQIDCLDFLLWQMKRGARLDCCCHEGGAEKGGDAPC